MVISYQTYEKLRIIESFLNVGFHVNFNGKMKFGKKYSKECFLYVPNKHRPTAKIKWHESSKETLTSTEIQAVKEEIAVEMGSALAEMGSALAEMCSALAKMGRGQGVWRGAKDNDKDVKVEKGKKSIIVQEFSQSVRCMKASRKKQGEKGKWAQKNKTGE